jgi:PAS domain S-box-containing protein
LLATDGSNSGLLSVVRDITEGSHAEQALRDSEERYRALFNTIDEGFSIIEMIFDADGKPVDYRFLQVSPSFEKHTGLRDVAGKKVRELIPTHEDHWFEAYGKVALTGEPIRFENHSEGMNRWFDVHASRFGEPEKHLVAVLFNDITPRKLAEKDLMAHAEELARADRRKDEFLAMLAHELRNPLAPLRNASEILQIEEVSPRERAQAQRLIRRQIENMSRMIDDLLDVSRITEGKIELRKEPVSLEAILNSAATLVKTACAAQGQELTVSLPSEPIHLSADPTRLEQVFGNLLGNASKYGGDGCRISLSAERVPGAEPPQAIVRVSDNGTGIDPELLPRIFDLFVQASRSLDRSHGGLGIGLTVVSRLVKMHDGSIEARSDGLGRGAEFTVHLPILSAPTPEPSRAAAPAPRNKGLRLLIVDDNRDSAESMAMLQELAGNETRIAHHGSEAIRIAAEFSPQAVLLDIGLPGMDGFEVARRLRAIPSLADCFLIALTGYGSDEDRQRTQAAGFDEHLVKPADLNLLRRWLEARK